MDYAKHYGRLIERARDRILERYTERHHVIPRCLGGSDRRENLVDLTPEEHFLAHQILVKLHPGNLKLIYAAHAMLMAGKRRGIQYTVNNKEFGWLRRMNAKANGDRFRGKKQSPEFVARCAAARKGKTSPPEAAAKISAALKGKAKSPEHVAKVSAALMGKPGTRRRAVTPESTREKQRI